MPEQTYLFVDGGRLRKYYRKRCRNGAAMLAPWTSVALARDAGWVSPTYIRASIPAMWCEKRPYPNAGELYGSPFDRFIGRVQRFWQRWFP